MYLNPTVEGMTEPMIYRLLNKDAPMLIQGMTVEMVLEGVDCSMVDTVGKVDNLDDGTDANRGLVRFTPLATDLVAALSPYYVRFIVTDGGGNKAPWPNGGPARLRVYAEGNPLCAA